MGILFRFVQAFQTTKPLKRFAEPGPLRGDLKLYLKLAIPLILESEAGWKG